jgi:hypothetical protein
LFLVFTTFASRKILSSRFVVKAGPRLSFEVENLLCLPFTWVLRHNPLLLQMRHSPITRRSFLKSASVASAVASFPAILRSQPPGAAQSPNNRLNLSLEWDAAAMRVTNIPEANNYITKQYRPGFGV